VDPGAFERCLELLADDAEGTKDHRRLDVVRGEQPLGLLRTPASHPAGDEPARMRVRLRERVDRVARRRDAEPLTLAVHPP
jgi:hypothetical protein